MSEPTGPLTAEDLARGWKDLVLKDLAGQLSTLRLTIPSWRKRSEVAQEFQQTQDSWTLIKPCLPVGLQTEQALDKLTPQSVGELQTLAVAMLCGNSSLNVATKADDSAKPN